MARRSRPRAHDDMLIVAIRSPLVARARGLATHLIRAGVDVRTVQELQDHADLQITACHLHSDMRTKQEAVGRLVALFGAAQAGGTVAANPLLR